MASPAPASWHLLGTGRWQSRPDSAAHALYRRWGRRVAGTCCPAPDAALMDVMITGLGG